MLKFLSYILALVVFYVAFTIGYEKGITAPISMRKSACTVKYSHVIYVD